jgi:DNA-binding HxlR family transcriptional regulator
MKDLLHRGDVYDPSCSARDVIGLVGSKWVLLIMPALSQHPMRTLQLRRAIPGISMKVLMQTLRSLERSGLIDRTEHRSARPHVEYALTALGASLCTVLVAVDRWAERNFQAIDVAIADYDRKRSASGQARSSPA